VVLEYASEGRVVGTERRYSNRYISVLTIREGEVARWRTISTRSLSSMRSAGRHAEYLPAYGWFTHLTFGRPGASAW